MDNRSNDRLSMVMAMIVTSSDDSLNDDARAVDLSGELVDGRGRVLVGVWIKVAVSAAVWSRAWRRHA